MPFIWMEVRIQFRCRSMRLHVIVTVLQALSFVACLVMSPVRTHKISNILSNEMNRRVCSNLEGMG